MFWNLPTSKAADPLSISYTLFDFYYEIFPEDINDSRPSFPPTLISIFEFWLSLISPSSFI